MSSLKVDLRGMDWQAIRPDVRQKIYSDGSRQLRLVEFDTSDGAEQWCEAGHIGYVLKGDLSISFDGEVIAFMLAAPLITSGVTVEIRKGAAPPIDPRMIADGDIGRADH